MIVDIQQRLAATMERRDEVVAGAVRLVRTAQLVGVPIVVTRQYPEGLGETDPVLAEAIRQVEASGHPVHHADKVAFDCFADQGFARLSRQVVVRSLCWQAWKHTSASRRPRCTRLRSGLEVQVVADACCSRDSAASDIALDRMRAAGAVVSGTQAVMYELVGEAGTDEFRALLQIVKS